jgi:hypothetical protein
MAVWALGEIAPDEARALAADALAAEGDEDVRAEWRACL